MKKRTESSDLAAMSGNEQDEWLFDMPSLDMQLLLSGYEDRQDLEALFAINPVDDMVGLESDDWRTWQLLQTEIGEGQMEQSDHTAPPFYQSNDEEMEECYDSNEEVFSDEENEETQATVVDNIPLFIGTALEEMRDRMDFKYKTIPFQGSRISLRWRSNGGVRQIGMKTMDEAEMAEAATVGEVLFPGKHWLMYERLGANFRPNSPVWCLRVMIGVEKDHLEDGFAVILAVLGFPMEHMQEVLDFKSFHVHNQSVWGDFVKFVMERLLPSLQRMEARVADEQSRESTDVDDSGEDEE